MSTLTPGEAQVMAKHELGLSPREIADELKISEARARVIVSTFDDDPRHDDVRLGRVRRGSAKLLRAILKAGGHR